MSLILAIDPGNERSGYCVMGGKTVLDSGVLDNHDMLEMIHLYRNDDLAIEMIASYGMPVGREVFETCVWIGRFLQYHNRPDEARLVYRKDVKLHLCGNTRAKDGNIRQAIIDLFPATGGGKTPQIGTRKQPGPLHGVSSHAWAALGVALTAKEAAWDRND